jgi:hypothetical protein
MRAFAALLLILTSGWLLYQTSHDFVGAGGHMSTDLLRTMSDAKILVPLAGGFLGLLGGTLVFFGGGGGAAIAIMGALLAAGFAGMAGGKFTGPIWDDELVVGTTMLVLAIAAALMKRQ